MKSVERSELNEATIIAYALARALFDELDGASKKRVSDRAIAHMPPGPNPLGSPPSELEMWRKAQAFLKGLGSN